MEGEFTIKPGGNVYCTKHWDWGIGVATYISIKENRAFVIWRDEHNPHRTFSDMCTLDELEDATK